MYELFKQGPATFIPVLLISIIVTLLAYGAFPVIFAKLYRQTITKKEYRKLCFGVNIAVLLIFVVINGGVINVAPYFIWTWIFYGYGVKILGTRGFMPDSDYLKDDPNRRTECLSCGYRAKDYFNNCPNCGFNGKRYVYIEDTDPILYCRKCGIKLPPDSQYCVNCGTKIVKE